MDEYDQLKTVDSKEHPVVITVDVGGTNFVFSAVCQAVAIVPPICLNSSGAVLEESLQQLYRGIRRVQEALFPRKAEVISMAVPGPCDYQAGIVWPQKNMSGYRDPLPLKILLESEFGIPVLMNNDADLFAYGEAMGGFLPSLNEQLSQQGITKQYQNLIGITLGSGFGVGLVWKGHILSGDVSSAGELWALRNKRNPQSYVEETLSKEGIRQTYSLLAGIESDPLLSPEEIACIALGRRKGDQQAALETYSCYGEVLGDALAQLLCFMDAPLVLGGGIALAYPLFSSSMKKELHSGYVDREGEFLKRPYPEVFLLDDPQERSAFFQKNEEIMKSPFSEKILSYEKWNRIPIIQSRRDTSDSIALGAYFVAMQQFSHS